MVLIHPEPLDESFVWLLPAIATMALAPQAAMHHGLDHLPMLIGAGNTGALVSITTLAWGLGTAHWGTMVSSAGLAIPKAEVLTSAAGVAGTFVLLLFAKHRSLITVVIVSGLAIPAVLHAVEAPWGAQVIGW